VLVKTKTQMMNETERFFIFGFSKKTEASFDKAGSELPDSLRNGQLSNEAWVALIAPLERKLCQAFYLSPYVCNIFRGNACVLSRTCGIERVIASSELALSMLRRLLQFRRSSAPRLFCLPISP
jgi:hypothetical protein